MPELRHVCRQPRVAEPLLHLHFSINLSNRSCPPWNLSRQESVGASEYHLVASFELGLSVFPVCLVPLWLPVEHIINSITDGTTLSTSGRTG